jgi:DNA-binding NarL/FixJ family response regulator
VVVRVLIADDQDLVRAGLAMILGSEPDIEVVAEAATGRQAVAMAEELRPDVVLMDIRMPDVDGIEATRRIGLQQHYPPTRVGRLTTFDLDEYVFDALRAGASGFLLKDIPGDQLAAGVRLVAAGDALLGPTILGRLIQAFSSPRPATPPPGLDQLTARELEVLHLLASGASNAEIGGELFISEKTVKTHVTRVLMKLGLRDRVQAAVLAHESGIVGR